MPRSPVTQLGLDVVDDLLVLLVASIFDRDRLAEGDANRFLRIDRTEIFEPFAVSPGIGQQCDRYHRHTGPQGKLHADGVELCGVESGAARGLRKHNDRDSLLQTLQPALHHRLEVLAGVVTRDGDRISGTHHVAKDGVIEQALLDHEGDRELAG